MKLASICYLPPPRIGHTEAFLANLKAHRPAYPIHFYSDWDWKLDLPNCTLDKVESPEKVKDAGNDWSIPKYAFIDGVHVAKRHGADYFLVLEPDCRVRGRAWDQDIFDEFFAGGDLPACGGTFYAWNMFNASPEWAKAYTDWRNRYSCKPWYASMQFGSDGCAEFADAHIFTNGALTVLNTKDMVTIFPEDRKETLARSTTAYDVAIGYGLAALYGGSNVFNVLKPLGSVFSYYGNRLLNEEARKELLRSAVRAVHQIKSDWKGPALC